MKRWPRTERNSGISRTLIGLASRGRNRCGFHRPLYYLLKSLFTLLSIRAVQDFYIASGHVIDTSLHFAGPHSGISDGGDNYRPSGGNR